MASLRITALTGVTGNEVNVTWAGQQEGSTITIYRTTTDYRSNPDSALDGGNLGDPLASGVTGTTYTDFSPTPGETYYYYVSDGTEWASDTITTSTLPEFVGNYVPVNMNTIDQNTLYIQTQNSRGSVFLNPLNIEPGNLTIIALKTTAAMTDATVNEMLHNVSGVEAAQILAYMNVSNFTGYQPKLSGSLQVKYTAQ